MEIDLGPDELRRRIPDYPDDTGILARLDSQGRLLILSAAGRPLGVARWNPERQALEDRTGQIHTVSAISNKLYDVLTLVLAEGDRTTQDKVFQITQLLSKHGLPIPPNGDVPAYLAGFIGVPKRALVSGMQAVFLNDIEAADCAFQEAAEFLRRNSAAFSTYNVAAQPEAAGSNDAVEVRQQHSGKGASLWLDVTSRRQGGLIFEGSVDKPKSTLVEFTFQSSTSKLPTAKFTLLGTPLAAAGRFDVEYIELGDKIALRIKATPRDEFRLYLVGEVVHAKLENRSRLTVHARHQFGRWAAQEVSISEKAGVRLRDLLVQLAERVDISGRLVSVTDDANVLLGKLRIRRMPAYEIVNLLLVEHRLYGEFDREGTFSVRTLIEEDRMFRAQTPLPLHPQHMVQFKGAPPTTEQDGARAAADVSRDEEMRELQQALQQLTISLGRLTDPNGELIEATRKAFSEDLERFQRARLKVEFIVSSEAYSALTGMAKFAGRAHSRRIADSVDSRIRAEEYFDEFLKHREVAVALLRNEQRR